MHFKKKLIFIIILACASIRLNATHLMGGEITWDCLGNGNYKFYMTLYRDCSDPTQYQIQYQNPGFGISVHNHPSVYFIAMTLLSRQDVTPACNILGPPASCNLQSPGSVEEHIFQSQEIQLIGVPPAQGWVFTYSDCCRNTDIFNINAAGAVGMTLRAKMFTYQGSNNSLCTDSSPRFEAKPVTLICQSPQPPNQEMLVYNQNASDPDRDSVSYSFAFPLDNLDLADSFSDTNPIALVFIPTMSVASPFPAQNTPGFFNSIPATLDPASGQIALSITGFGKFVSVVRVQSFRCGQLIAEVFREIQFVSVACGLNESPIITSSIGDSTAFSNQINLTKTAGELIELDLVSEDQDLIPTNGQVQSITLSANGLGFSSDFTNPSQGCPFPPCATLNPVPGTSAVGTLQTNFNWQTDCGHAVSPTTPIIQLGVECYRNQTTHNFLLGFADDFCPYPKTSEVLISVNVVGPELTPSPSLTCAEVINETPGAVKLEWALPQDPENQFEAYHIFKSDSLNGAYFQIATLSSITSNTYIDLDAQAHLGPRFYYISTRTGCAGNVLNYPIDTISTIYLKIFSDGPESVAINWNDQQTPNPVNQQSPYALFKSSSETIPNFTLVGNFAENAAADEISFCNQFFAYKVEVQDASGCKSISNEASGILNVTGPIDAAFSNDVDLLTVYFYANDPDAALYQWDFGDGNSATGAVVSYQYNELGVYNVSLIVSDSCGNSDTLTQTIDLFVSAVVTNESVAWRVFPNPSTRDIMLQAEKPSNFRIEVYAPDGKRVKEFNEFGKLIRLDFGPLAPGIYQIHCHSATESRVFRIVRE